MAKTDPMNMRRTYFIDKQFQVKFIVKFCVLVLISGLVIIGLVYLLSQQATTVSIVNSRVMVRRTADFLLPLIWQTVGVAVTLTSLATIFVTLFVSHRIAGPLYRFRRVMEGMEKGDFSRGFKLRTHDQLQELAETMNRMLKTNRQQLLTLQELVSALNSQLSKIDESEIPPAKAATLHEIKSLAKELLALADRYKT